MSIIREIDKLEESEILEFDQLIQRIRVGDPTALDDLVARTTIRVNNIATILVGGKNGTASLRPSDLTQDVFLKLLKANFQANIRNVRHYFSLFARTIGQVLLDYHKSKSSQKRGGGRKQIELDIILDWMENQHQSIEVVQDAMHSLELDQPETFEVVQLKYFGMLAEAELCRVTGYKPWEIQRLVRFGKAYVRDHIEGNGPP